MCFLWVVRDNMVWMQRGNRFDEISWLCVLQQVVSPGIANRFGVIGPPIFCWIEELCDVYCQCQMIQFWAVSVYEYE
jgi:hypothetical protein